MKKKLVSMCNKAHAKVTTFALDVSGSDTTEKIGMVVVAIVIVGLLAAAMNKLMPNLFNSVINTAQNKLNNIFNFGNYS